MDEILDRITFRFNQHEVEFFSKNPGLNQTATLHDGMYMIMRRDYQRRFEHISMRLLVIILGMILVSFSSMSLFVVPFLFLFSGGTVIILLGFCMLFLEVRNGRRKQR